MNDLHKQIEHVNMRKLQISQQLLSDVQVGMDVSDKLVESFADLRKCLSEIDPCQLLSILSSYHLASVSLDESPELSQPERLQMSHVQLVQAVALTIPVDQYLNRPVFPSHYTTVSALAWRLNMLAIIKRAQKRKGELEQDLTSELVRLNTQLVRGWAYPQQVRRIVKELFTPLDTDLLRACGFTAATVVDFIFELVAESERRLTEHVVRVEEACAEVFAAQTKTEAFEAFRKIYDQGPFEKDWLLLTLDQVKDMAQSFTDVFLTRPFEFSLADLQSFLPSHAESQAVRNLIDGWSLSFGELPEQNIESFFLDNPVRARPFIRIAKDSYFCPVPGALIDSCFRLMESLIKSLGPDETSRYHRQRTELLENETFRLLREAFPNAEVHPNVRWGAGAEVQGESDVVVKLEPYLLIWECKSHRPNEVAVRGGTKSIATTVKEMIQAPASQSRRFADWLHANPGLHGLSTGAGLLELDTKKLLFIGRFSVCLDTTVGRLFNWPALQQSGLIDQTVQPTPIISITDLECVFDVLPTQSQRLHYLLKREEVENGPPLHSDELGLLWFYLQNSFLEFSAGTQPGVRPSVELYSFGFDTYFMHKWAGNSVCRPKHNITAWCQQLLQAIDDMQVPLGHRLGCVLLNFDLKEQFLLRQRIETVIERIKNAKEITSDLANVVRLVVNTDRDVVVLTAVVAEGVETVTNLAAELAASELNRCTASISVSLGFDVDNPKEPCNVFASASSF